MREQTGLTVNWRFFSLEVPTMFLSDGQCLFGPVLIDPPTGEAAVRLWDAVVAWTEFPHLYEQLIVDTFRPDLEARDWVSTNRGEVISFGDAVRGDGPAGKSPGAKDWRGKQQRRAPGQ